MPRLLLLLLVALAGAGPAAAAAGEVYVRGTSDALLVRVPDADLADCELLRPSAFRVILRVRDLALPSAAPADRFELARSVRVVGPDMIGGTESRIVIELTSSLLQPTLEEVGSGVVLTLRLPEAEPIPPPPPPVVEPAEQARPLSTPWRRARELSQAARADARGETQATSEAVDPADAERDRRAAEEEERRLKREAREQRVASGGGQAPQAAMPSPAPVEEAPAVQPPSTAPAPAAQAEPPPVTGRIAQQGAVQPSPATTMPAGMVRVAGGSFLMGTPAGDGFPDEEPQHAVDLDPFWIDTHEVTIGEFRRSPVRLPEQPAWNVADDMPVVNVTWIEAEQYCDWANQRLPTEAEWEKAARGSEGARYPWGDGWAPEFANSGVAGDGHETTAAAGSFPDGASPSGALDLSGNVWEWTNDWYSPDAYLRRDVTNPIGPQRGAHKVARGGSFRGLYSVNVRSAIRLPLAASTRRDDVGFRCASDAR